MRIEIFYRHALADGGAPVGVRHLATALSKHHRVTLRGEDHGLTFPDLAGVDVRPFRHRIDLLAQLLKARTAPRPDLVVVVGYFIPENGLAALRARWAGTPIILHPIAQVWDESFRGKIFTHGCDVRSLESKDVNADGLVERLSSWLNPHVKAAYKHTAGRLLVDASDYVAVLSNVERRQFQRHYPRKDDDFLILPWGIDPFDTTEEEDSNYYRDELGHTDDRANFIVWGRLDWYYKGLDRLLYGVRAARDRLGALPFRVFLCGPDYRGGSVAAQAFIEEHGLKDDVRLLLPGSYRPGSKQPLRDADASILLSRWDGSPRALRESIYLSTPILVSRETNFGALAADYSCGLVVESPDDPERVADDLVMLSRRDVLAQCTNGTQQLRPHLSWSFRAEQFVRDVESRLQLSTRTRSAVEVLA